MIAETNTVPIIHTKLHRPPVASDHLHRQHLLDRLDQRRHRPLTLVSAPAGYGKTTLMSCWLESCDVPSAWISLDENDNDLRTFLAYFLAAVQRIFPDAVRETQAMSNAVELPILSILSRSLINELDQIEKNFILVLDDYHTIADKAVQGLVIELLKYPPSPMHLVLAARRDPSIPLTINRARSRMTEIRIQDLSFSDEETAALLQGMLDIPVDGATAAVLKEKTEGWVVGLRLAALSMRQRIDLDHIVANLPEDNHYVMDYLFAEVLSNQPEDIREYLLVTAILNRFCTPLCDAICVSGTRSLACKIGGKEFIKWLKTSDLFVVPLDDQGRWYRYHHLFQKLLQDRLKRKFSPDDIADFHKRAGVWFNENALVEEAFYHTLEGGDTEGAALLVVHHRTDVMNQEQWYRLARWMGMLPANTIEKFPELLITQAWSFWNHMRLPEMTAVLDQTEPLLSAMPSESVKKTELQGELYAMRSIQYYLSAPCDGSRALDYAQRAVSKISRHQYSARGFAMIMLAMSYQMAGDIGRAHSVVLKALNEKEAHRTTQHTRLLTTLGFLQWLEADLVQLEQTAQEQFKLSMEIKLTESMQIAKYFLGICHYCRNDLDSAEGHLAAVVRPTNAGNIFNFTHSAFALALVYQSQDRPSKAREIHQMVVKHSLETGHMDMLQVANAFGAELAVRQGNFAEVSHWEKTFDPLPFRPTHRFYMPQLTLAKVFLVKGTPESHERAVTLLIQLHEFFTTTHNTRFLIDVLALQSLLYDARGDEPKAMLALGRAITLAEPGGFIRPFLDLGPKMADLLSRLTKQNMAIQYVGQLLVAFRKEATFTVSMASEAQPLIPLPSSHPHLDETLTKRELEILALLAQRLQNREIADKLFISPETVKRHTINIYGKLNVHTRQEAVTRANDLGLLSRLK
jgi:LuxR family maltose regulon positive regulatory protein